MKSTLEEIRNRFDNDVERFSNENTGQTSTVDSTLVLEMLVASIQDMHADAHAILDIGCGAGNFTVRILKALGPLECSLVDLSQPMLEKAWGRVVENGGTVDLVVQDDILAVTLPKNRYDIAIAAQVLHHLRSRNAWDSVLRNVFASLKPAGTFWIGILSGTKIEQSSRCNARDIRII